MKGITFMTETLYFGTYTKKTSEGIYKATLDTTTGLLSNLQLVAKEPNPTYLTFDRAGHLYSVGAENGDGGIAAYDNGGKLINHVVDAGAPLSAPPDEHAARSAPGWPWLSQGIRTDLAQLPGR